jgi:UDP-hydrolysing UDP-N-acetyl-D-glucosamine 2-epimerase
MSKLRKIMIVSGTRADYGLLKNIIKTVQASNTLELQLVVTGSHLSQTHGYTVSEIEADGFPIAHRLPILYDVTDVASATAAALVGMQKIISNDRPDIILVLGDRYEAFAVATAALLNHVPLAHVHGGELTLGALDDAFRHSITKMAWLHFTSAEAYRKRVIRLGESPDRVYNVGAPVIDSIQDINVPIEELEKVLGLKLIRPIVLATFHPETCTPGKVREHIQTIWNGIKQAQPGTVVFTKANADAEGNEVNTLLEELIAKKEIPNSTLVSSLGHRRYLGLMKLADVGLGNSSSLVIEAPILGTPTVNIGRRQDGRIRSETVLDVEFNQEAIAQAIKLASNLKNQNANNTVTHPFGSPGVAQRIVEVLADCELPQNLIKAFHE